MSFQKANYYNKVSDTIIPLRSLVFWDVMQRRLVGKCLAFQRNGTNRLIPNIGSLQHKLHTTPEQQKQDQSVVPKHR
jgi:hypothetical protein